MRKTTIARAATGTAKKTARKSTKKKAKKTARKTAKKTTKKRPRKVAKKPVRRTTKKAAKKPVAKKTTARSAAAGTGAASASARRESAPAEKRSAPGAIKKGKRPILVPLDFSRHSEAALVYAAHLAERLRAPLTVLHVVHDLGEAPGYYRMKGRKKQLRKLEDVAGDMLDEFMSRMITRHPKRTAIKSAKRLLVTGLPATRILEVANRIKPKMVIMGSAGRTALSRFLLGSKAEQVLRICPFPVTIVKAGQNK